MNGKKFDWRDYGGPLALFRLRRYVRFEKLGDDPKRKHDVPKPANIIYQQGDLILKNKTNNVELK